MIPVELGPLLAALARHEQRVDRPADQNLQVRGRERLGKVVERPLPQRLDAGFDARVPCHHDDHGVAVRPESRAQQHEAVDLRHVQIDQHEVEAATLQQVQRVLATPAHRHIVALLAEDRGATLAQGVLVVDNEDANACLQLRSDGQQRREILPFVDVPHGCGPVSCNGYRHSCSSVSGSTGPYAGFGPRCRDLAAAWRAARAHQAASATPHAVH